MKKILVLLALLCLGAAALASDLADAAKGAKSKRKKSSSKVLTNADVKKSKGRIAETPNLSAEPAGKQPSMLEQHAAKRAADKATGELRAKQAQLVADLEKELAAIEQQYYQENDPNRRDTEIVKKFNDVKAKLDAARAQIP